MLVSDEAHLQYAELRPERLAVSPSGFLALLHYTDAFAALGNQDLRPMALEGLDFAGVVDGPVREFFELIVFTQEGAQHQRLRRLVASAFSPRTVDRLRDSVRDHLRDVLDTFVERGNGELVDELCKPLAIRALCDLLGVPREDLLNFQQWAGGMGLAFGVLSSESRDIVETSLEEITTYAQDLIDHRRSQPRDDLLALQVTTPHIDRFLSRCSALGATNRHGMDLRRIRRWRAAMQRRLSVSNLYAHSTTRIAVADTDINGIPIAEGSIIEPMIAAANSDPSVFEAPDQYRPERTGPRMLSFGHGIHTCLGAALARLEVGETLAAVSHRLAGWRVEGVEAPHIEWFPLSEPFRGVARMPITVHG